MGLCSKTHPHSAEFSLHGHYQLSWETADMMKGMEGPNVFPTITQNRMLLHAEN